MACSTRCALAWLTGGRQTPATTKPQTIADFPVAVPMAGASAAAKPPGGWSLQKGQLGLGGKVVSVDAQAGSFTLDADVVATPPGDEQKLAPLRRKLVRVTPATDLGGRTLSTLKPGMQVRVAGQDGGAGKPLTAASVTVAGDL